MSIKSAEMPSDSNAENPASDVSLEDPDYWLLTPGPLSTHTRVRQAMLSDWGSWDSDFRTLTAGVRQSLLAMLGSPSGFECVLLQGSGTYVVEAMLSSFLPVDSKALILVNGAYGQRVCTVLDYLGRPYRALDKGDYLPPRRSEVDEILSADPDISHVVVVHCETSSGILNPLKEISDVVSSHGKGLLIDAMSAFGAIEVDPDLIPFDALVSSANKCIEGVPGFGFVLVREDILKASKGRSHSLSLDVHAQWDYMNRTGQWRFTPPTHAMAAFAEALALHAGEGGVMARGARYARYRDLLVAGMRDLGFVTLLDDDWMSPIIVTFFNPAHPAFDFTEFYDRLKAAGYVIYPGKLTVVDSFRVGCIGAFGEEVMTGVVEAAAAALTAMGVDDASPPEAAMQERRLLVAQSQQRTG